MTVVSMPPPSSLTGRIAREDRFSPEIARRGGPPDEFRPQQEPRMWCRSAERLARIERKLDALALMMKSHLNKENAMAVDLAQIQADVGRNADVVQSAVILLSGLKSQIEDLKTKVSSDPQSQAAIAALSQSLETQTKALADAVAANTVAAAAS
jgi:small-conductance mechanosensitive channel